MSIKLIASDIDGTLVPDGTDQINPEIFDVILQLKKKGIIFVGASGRQYASMKRLFAPVADEIMYISDSGGMTMYKGEVFGLEEMNLEVVHEVVDDILKLEDCDVILCGQKYSYAPNRNSKMYHWLKKDYKFDIKPWPDLSTPIDDKIVKVSLYHPLRAEEITSMEFTPKWSKRLKVFCAGKQWIDCVNQNATKGHALHKIQNHFGISREETMAFGDNMNDLEMLMEAKYSFAIGNARQEIKKTARYIADTNINDGVLKELKKLL